MGGAVEQAERGGAAGQGRRGAELATAGQPAARGADGGAWLGLNFDAETANEWQLVAKRAMLVRFFVSLNALLAFALAAASMTRQLAPVKWAIAVGVLIWLWTLATAYFLFASSRRQGKEVFTRVIINMLPVDVVLSYLAMSASTSLADVSLLFVANTAAQAVFMFLATFALIFAAAYSHILADRHSVALGTFLA